MYTNYPLHFPTPSLPSTMTSTLPSLHLFPRLLPRHHHPSLSALSFHLTQSPLSTYALQFLSSILPLSLPLPSLHHPFPVSLPSLVSAFLPSTLFLHRSLPACLLISIIRTPLPQPSFNSCIPSPSHLVPPSTPELSTVYTPPFTVSPSSMLPLLSSRLSSVYSKTMPLMSTIRKSHLLAKISVVKRAW